MESSSVVGNFLFPESIGTPLLSSSDHLRSSLLAAEHNTTFRYRDMNYDSASAALDDYIADFESSFQNNKPLTPRLIPPRSLPSVPSRLKVSTLRNKDVLRERLSDKELDSLNLPLTSHYHSVNRDRHSVTTDELLSVPYDHSVPVAHTSAWIEGLVSQSRASRLCPSFSRIAHRTQNKVSSSHAVPQLNHHHPHIARGPKRGTPRAAMLKPDIDVSSVNCYKPSHRADILEWAEPSTLHQPPHWLTSSKTDMHFRGTKVPDLEYPDWIQDCDLRKSPPPTESQQGTYHGLRLPTSPRPRVPSWVPELEDDDPDDIPTHKREAKAELECFPDGPSLQSFTQRNTSPELPASVGAQTRENNKENEGQRQR